MVVYRSLKDETTWIRPLEMFVEEVDELKYNHKGPRFVYIGE